MQMLIEFRNCSVGSVFRFVSLVQTKTFYAKIMTGKKKERKPSKANGKVDKMHFMTV